MDKYQIPSNQLEGFKSFISIDSKKRDAIISIFANSKVGISITNLANEIKSQLSIPIEKSESITYTLASLLSVQERVEDKLDEFVDGILEAFYHQTKTKAKPKDTQTLKKQFKNIISSKTNFNFTVKAKNLLYERERIIESFRILTDVRPIFGDSDGSEIKASVIIHNLKIEYFSDGAQHTAVFAIDETDLKEMSKLILRAQQKEKALKKLLANTNLTVIDSNANG